MLNKLSAFIREYDMVAPGDHIICAVSGGADSMALLWGMYLLKEKLQIRLSAAHFNHGLRGEESDRDERFVQEFCQRFDIPLYTGTGQVIAGKKGLEAAAREARYAFLRTLPGKLATAHTANDNAETVLLHLVRGTALKGLGGIAPVGKDLIRPMLGITRQEVEDFLAEYCIFFVEDSSNGTDQFLRNRLRHHLMPLLEAENPQLALSLSAMALDLQQDAQYLDILTEQAYTLEVEKLRQLPRSLRGRILERFLKECGVKEPERSHIDMAESLVFSDRPSAQAHLPGGITIRRCYSTLCAADLEASWEAVEVCIPGVTELPTLGMRLICQTQGEGFRVLPKGKVVVRSRCSGDEIRLSGGTKSLKKLFIDRKIPAAQRHRIPVLADEAGVLGVCGVGANLDRVTQAPDGWCFRFEKYPDTGC